MKDFDEARAEREKAERTFKLGGETFVHRVAVAPEKILRWNQASFGEIEMDEAKWIELYDETVLALIEPGQEEKWAKVRDQDAEHPIGMASLNAVIEWLFVEVSGRPTGPPSDSSDSRGGTGTTSTAASASPAPTAV